MTFSDLEWHSKISDHMECRAASLRQLSFLLHSHDFRVLSTVARLLQPLVFLVRCIKRAVITTWQTRLKMKIFLLLLLSPHGTRGILRLLFVRRISFKTAEQTWLNFFTATEVCPGRYVSHVVGDLSWGPGRGGGANMPWGDIVSVLHWLTCVYNIFQCWLSASVLS